MATLEQENASLKDQITAFQEKENSTRQVFDEMKGRLKEALDEKRDFEIEYLQLQKNYVKMKQQAQQAASGAGKASEADKERMHKLIAENSKAQDEMQVLR